MARVEIVAMIGSIEMPERPPSDGKSLRLGDAAKLLGLADGERFRVLAQGAGVVGVPDRSGRLWFSEADVERVRNFKLRTSWERVLDDDKDE